ncbi:MAG: glycosyltransferase, partial [Patescibacteria group bacterium]
NVLSELAVLGKPTIIVPIPNSLQEANAKYFLEKKAAIVLNQKELTNEKLVTEIRELINNKEKQNQLSENIKKIVPINASEKIAKEVLNLTK